MSRFHVKNDGKPGKCSAQPGRCPLGGAHFDNESEALTYAEHVNESGVAKEANTAGDDALVEAAVDDPRLVALRERALKARCEVDDAYRMFQESKGLGEVEVAAKARWEAAQVEDDEASKAFVNSLMGAAESLPPVSPSESSPYAAAVKFEEALTVLREVEARLDTAGGGGGSAIAHSQWEAAVWAVKDAYRQLAIEKMRGFASRRPVNRTEG